MATHFYGVVLAGAVLVALAVLDRREGKPLGPVFGVGGAVGVAVLGIVPFIRASMVLYRTGPKPFEGVGGRLNDLKNLLAGQVGHVSLKVFGPLETLGLIAGSVLVLLAIRSIAATRRGPVAGGVLALGTGLLAVVVAKLALNKFDAATPHYNVWMRPGLCLFMAAGTASREPRARRTALAASVVLIVCQAGGVYQLAVHGDHFAHGPHGTISRMIRRVGPGEVAVVHDDPSRKTIFIASPLRCEWGVGLTQYLPELSAGGRPIVRAMADARPSLALESAPYRYLLIVRPRATRPGDLVAQLRAGDRPAGRGWFARRLHESDDWRLVSETHAVALISAEISLFERRRARPADRRAAGQAAALTR